MNYKKLTNNFNFRITHIYRKNNARAYKLASYGTQSFGYTWWDSLPSFVD